MSTTMSLTDMDHLSRGSPQDPRRQSQAESISTLWSSADVPLFFDTRPSLSAVSGHRSGLDAPISLGPNGVEGEDTREILSDQGSSPAMLSDSTPRSSFDPIPSFPGTNSSPSSFAASRYGRKHSQDSPRRRPPPLQLQSSNAFMNFDGPPMPLPASQSHNSQMTMVPQAQQEVNDAATSPRTNSRTPDIDGLPVTASILPYYQPVVTERGSSLRKKTSSSATASQGQTSTPSLPPAVRNRLYARADQFFQADYSLASPVSLQHQTQPPVSDCPMSAPPTAAFIKSSHISHISRKSSVSLSSEALSLSRDNSMPSSLSFSQGSTNSSSIASSAFIGSEDGHAASPARPSRALPHQIHSSGFEHTRPSAYGMTGVFPEGQMGKPAKVRDPTMAALPGQMYAVLPPTPQRAFHSQQASPAFAPPMPNMGPRSSNHAVVASNETAQRLPLLATQYLGAPLSECMPMVQSPVGLPTPVSSFSESSDTGSISVVGKGSHCSHAEPQPAQGHGPKWSFTSPSISPTQPIVVDRNKDQASRLRTVSASRLLHAASMKLLRNDNVVEVPHLPLPKGFPTSQRPSTATTDGCNLRPRARTVGDKERPVSLQPAARIPEKAGSEFLVNGGARSPQGSLIPIPASTMTTSSVTGKASLSFRPKSKGGWASHLSGGLTLHVDQESQRSVQINLAYLSYDPFGRWESLVPATVEGTRPSTPKRSKATPKAEDEESTGILEFGPMQGVDDGWVFQNSAGGPAAPILRHITVGPEIKADVLTRQARLNLGTDGVHEVFGSEKKGKLGWRFIYRVEPCLDGIGRPVASGEKVMRPLKFLCSATLLEPSRAQKSRLINLVRKQVNANLESTPVRSPASASSLTEITIASSSPSSTMPSPLAPSSRSNILKSTQLQHIRKSSITPSQSQQLLHQHQQPLQNPMLQAQVINSAVSPVSGAPHSATHSLRAQFSPYNMTFAASSASLVSPSTSTSIVAAVQRLDPSQVSVPANLPAGVVPFKLVRPLANKTSVSSLQASQIVPMTATSHPEAVIRIVNGPNGDQTGRSASAATLPPVRPRDEEATSPQYFRPRLPSFGDKPAEPRRAPVVQPSSVKPAASGQTAAEAASRREEALRVFEQRAESNRRARSNTLGDTKLRRPMTASELIKRQWEDKQRDEDVAHASAASGWTVVGMRAQNGESGTFRSFKEASAATNAVTAARSTGAPASSKGSSNSGAQVTVLTPEFFGAGGERRRSRTIGSVSRSHARPYTAHPSVPPLPHSATAAPSTFGSFRSQQPQQGAPAQQLQHSTMAAPSTTAVPAPPLTPGTPFRPALVMHDSRYPAFAGGMPAALSHADLAGSYSSPLPPVHPAHAGSNAAMPSAVSDAHKAMAAPLPDAGGNHAMMPMSAAAASALLRQMPTTIVQAPVAGSAPVPPKRSQRRPRTAQAQMSSTTTTPTPGASGAWESAATAVAAGGLVVSAAAAAAPGTPQYGGGGGLPRSGSFGVAPLVNFSPQKIAA